VVLLFAAVVLLYVVPVPWMVLSEEPYPALRMPSFTGTAPAGNALVLRSVEVRVDFADGGTADVDRRDLLADMPDSHHDRVLEVNFGTPGSTARPLSRTVRLLRQLFPDIAADVAPSPDTPAATRAWLRGRLEVLYPRRTATRVCFRWYNDTYAGRGALGVTNREFVGEHCVYLTDDR
jgi:hypothetical protein